MTREQYKKLESFMVNPTKKAIKKMKEFDRLSFCGDLHFRIGLLLLDYKGELDWDSVSVLIDLPPKRLKEIASCSTDVTMYELAKIEDALEINIFDYKSIDNALGINK